MTREPHDEYRMDWRLETIAGIAGQDVRLEELTDCWRAVTTDGAFIMVQSEEPTGESFNQAFIKWVCEKNGHSFAMSQEKQPQN